jgi:hypothetical protein
MALSKSAALRFLALPALLAAVASAQDASSERTELNWPRKFESNGDQVVVYDPQIESWENHELLKATAAVVVTASGEKNEAYGVVDMEVKTETQPESRIALLKDRTLTSVRFSGLPKDRAEKSEAIVRRVLGMQPPLTLSLDYVLTYMKDKAKAVPSINVNLAPPPIYVSQEPAILVIFLGEPDFKPIEGTDLQFATNTNWDVIRNPGDGRTYLLNGDGWISTKELRKGGWDVVSKLPEAFSKIPPNENWSEVRKAIPGKLIPVPKVFVATEPSELIFIDGPPTYEPIPGTRLSDVSNCSSDLFRHEGDGHFYYLTSGRWFKAKTLDGPWSSATGDLPGDFSKIPKDSSSAEVLASVPGTQEADDAVLLASVPRKATVQRNGVTLSVTYDGEPKFEAIGNTGVWYAVNTPYNVFRVREKFYCCYEAIWFEAPRPSGPWTVCDSVPKEIYTIPANHPKYNVTYVRVESSTPTEVVVSYTSGYTGMYVCSGVVMFGLGWSMWYGPWWYYHYPPYWYAYGCGARYGWYGGCYYRAGYGYGPYGGVGFATAYNPATGAYARGAYAYGPYGGRYTAQSYNPYTGTYKSRSGGYTPYSSWGRGVAVQGSNWVRGGYYSNSQGTVAGISGSGGGKIVGVGNGQGDRTFVGRSGSGDIYAGRDGNVYRRTDDGWQKYDNGNWNPVSGDRPSATTRDNPRPETRDVPKAENRDVPRADTRDVNRERPTQTDTMNRLQQDSQNRSRANQATRQYNSTPRSYGGGRGGRGGRR